MRSKFGIRVTSSPRKRTVPRSGKYKPERLLKNVVFPAPFGPITAWIIPFATLIETSSTAWTPPNDFEMLRASRSAASPCTLISLDSIPASRRRPVLLRPEETLGKSEDARDEQAAEKDLPSRRDRRNDIFPDDVDDRPHEWTPQRPRSAENHREDEISRLMPIEHERKREHDQQRVERAGEPGHRRRDQEGDEDETVGIQAEITDTQLVLLDRDERPPERRTDQIPHRRQDRDENREHHEVKRLVSQLEVPRAEAKPRPRKIHSILAAGHIGEAIRDEIEYLAECDHQQREIDPATAQQKRPDDQCADHGGDDADDRRDDEMDVEILDREAGTVGAQTEERRVPEGEHPGITEQ